ncbi:hypothetical protein EDEG_00457 [Edhazardia aedis USNM 41457]|uniref:UBC core domain-containing protein n=1 Tax=Edhazardia aedis (strain USNM 41457) TaxID=1003232 RepID=J9DFN0_EDHAE|nr:hypothetical protein EDEG_00457 [Edhazardia aedis USNM 41457]|eukprot:EJW01410.1 hypothetical protein EDEG_00457 [Edhazardia aedis USNM 41457]
MSSHFNATKSRRIMKEIQEMKNDPPSNCSAGPISEADPDTWSATIIGPPGTPYEGGTIELLIKLPPNYPFSPPKVSLITPIFHCNVKADTICLDILKSEWSPALTIGKVLLSISSLLGNPNPDDPLDNEAARLYREDKQAYWRMAKRSIQRHEERKENNKQ